MAGVDDIVAAEYDTVPESSLKPRIVDAYVDGTVIAH